MKKLIIAIFATTLALTHYSCEKMFDNNKDDDDDLPVSLVGVTNADFVGVWKAKDFYIGVIPVTQSCRLDDEMILANDGSYTYDGGSTLCGGEDNQTIKQGTWEFDSITSSLIFDKSTSIEYSTDIKQISESSLELKGEYMGIPINGDYVK